jgi:hypothetical protein
MERKAITRTGPLNTRNKLPAISSCNIKLESNKKTNKDRKG